MKHMLGMAVCAIALNAGGLAMAEEPPKNCLDTFRTPEFQAIDLREPQGVTALLNFFAPLKGQTCTLDQIEAFFNAKHAITFNKDQKNISFRIDLNTSGWFFKDELGIGSRVEHGRIVDIAVAKEGIW